MDNPATKIGEYKNRIADALVHPNNHGLLRHNPDAVSRVMTGTGGIDPAHKNIARVHKIADVAANSAPVDGWLPKTLRQEAKQLVSHINEEGHLPKKLPTWVDSSGPLLKKTAAPAAKGVTKAAPAVGLAVETGVRGFGAFKTEQQYHQGRIDKRERGARHAENAGGLVGGVGGAGAGALGGAAIGAPFAGVGAVPGATIGGILGGVGGGVAGDYVGSKSGRVLYEGFTR